MPKLVLSFLGGFQVLLDQRPLTRFRSAKNQGLLVYLACNNDKPISRETLAALFWPETAEKEARHNLRQALYRLRRLLNNSEETYLRVHRKTVQFNATADYLLDVEQFTKAIDSNNLAEAIEYYAGDLLPGFSCSSEPFEVWLRGQREYLHQLALEAMLQAAEDGLQAGDNSTAVVMAQRQLVLEPWREPAYRQLMQAHALMGDRSSALAQFERCREQLWAEIGVEPAPETIQLVNDIKAGRVGLATAVHPLTPPVKTTHNLPADTTPFIGREKETADLCIQLKQDQRRLVTIVAPGGMGKTRLAIEVGQQMLPAFRDGVMFVDLAAVTEPDEIASVMAAVLSYQAPDKTQPLLPQLLNTLAQRSILLILDNFEQLVRGAPLIDQILKTCPELAILVTSRQPLNLVSESRYPLQGLDFPDLLTVDDALDWSSVQLFVDSGRRARPGYMLTDDNLVYVLQICRLVQGMPLALILAAAWLELLSSAEIAVEIERSLGFLSSDLVDLPHRQRSMHAVFDRSWQHLQPDEQTVLAKLSVFRGGFSRDAAEKVAGANLRILLSLVNKSFLQRQGDNGRYVMHELLRQYAAEQRERLGVSEEARLAHCRYFAQIVPQEMGRVLYFLPLLLPRDYANDWDNFQYAWAYALRCKLPAELANLANGMVQFNETQGIQSVALIEEAMSVAHGGGMLKSDATLFRLRAAQIRARQLVDATSEVNNQFIALIDELEQSEHRELRYWLCIQLAMQWWKTKDPGLIDWLDEAQAIADALQSETLNNMARAMRIWGYIASGQPVEAANKKLKKLLTYFESSYPESFIRYGILRSLSMACGNDQQYEEAIRFGKQALNIAARWRELFWIRLSFDYLAREYEHNGQLEQTLEQHRSSLEWHVAQGNEWQVITFFIRIALFNPHMVADDTLLIQYLSMIEHHPESTAYNRHLISDKVANLRTSIGPEAFAVAWEAGKLLDIDDVVQQLRLRWS